MERFRFKWCSMVLTALLLTACMGGHHIQPYLLSPAPTNGQIKLAQASLIINELKHDPAVEYTQVGETVRIIVFSDALFNPRSANIRDCATLDRIAKLMLMLETMTAEVGAYTNSEQICNLGLNMALSKRQADVVAEYLWAKGLDTRIMVPRGYGDSQPLSRFVGDAINRRIEIKFQYIPYEIGR